MRTAHRLFRDEHLLLLSFYLFNFLMQPVYYTDGKTLFNAHTFRLHIFLVRRHFRLSQMNHRYVIWQHVQTNLVNRQPIIVVLFFSFCTPEPISIQW